ncbi:uncharacterized protein LOC131670873 [Phymastichus coffea]|uniref:uncharacterized protein LOC131670873 n=1 Tax=Phymastichus coffea TaxID=108790 RepID=UPI00273B0775|nr:uncharacterized protein LOC131670873 [Phymastichus coffea]
MFVLGECFMMFSYAGAWRPIGWDGDRLKTSLYYIYTISAATLVYSLTVSELVGAFLLTDSLEAFTDISFLLVSTVSVCCKLASIIFRRQKIIQLAEMLLQDHCLPRNTIEMKILRRFDKTARYLTLSCFVLAEMTVSVMSTGPLLISRENRTLPFKSWLPYTIVSPVTFWLSYVHQTAAIFTCATINVAHDSLICGFMIQACSQLELLNWRLLEMPQMARLAGGNQLSEAKIIAKHIRHHTHIYKFAENVNAIFSPTIVMQFCMSSVVLSLSVYQMSVSINDGVQFVTMVLYLCCMLVQFFMYCWFGNEVTLKSLDFGQSVYEIDWTELRARTSRDLVIMMLRAKRPIVMSCGAVITLSVKSFVTILKASYSAFNVLQRSSRQINALLPETMQVLPEAFALASCVGLWRSSDSSSAYGLYTCFTVATMSLFLASQLVAMLLSAGSSLADFADATYMLLSTVNASVKGATVLLGRRRVSGLAEALLSSCCLPRNDEERRIAACFRKIARYNVIICISLAEVTVIVLGAWPLILPADETALPLRAWHPYNASDGLGYWCSYLHQAAGLMLTAAFDVAVDTLATGLMIQACAQLDIMVCRLRAMAEACARSRDREAPSRTERAVMKQSVEHHLVVFKLADDINATFGPVFTVQFCLSSVVLCISIYKLTAGGSHGSEIFMPLYLASMVVELFIYCYFGNELTLKSKSLSSVLFGIDWTLLSLGFRKNLTIMILRSSKPVKIATDNLVRLSLESFVKAAVIKSYSYLFNRDKMDQLLGMFAEDCCLARDEVEKNIRKACEDKFKKLAKIMFFFFEILVISFMITPLSFDIELRILPYPVYLPYSLKNLWIYWLSYAHHVLTGIYLGHVAIMSDLIATGCMWHLCGQLEILKYRLQKLPDMIVTTNDVSFERQLMKECVRHHVHLYNIADFITIAFSVYVVFQFYCDALAVCMSVYQLTMITSGIIEKLAFLSYLGMILGRLFLVTYFGNEVYLKSESLTDAIFEIDWTPLSTEVKKSLLMMIQRSSKPIVVSSRFFVQLTLETFIKVVKVSYSGYNLLTSSVHHE